MSFESHPDQASEHQLAIPIEMQPPPIDWKTVHLARQPILNEKLELVGFELLFRSDNPKETLQTLKNLDITARVLVSAFADIGLEDILGPYFGSVNVDAEFLMSEFAEHLPPKKIIYEILETVDHTPELVARCKQLKNMGFRFWLDDYPVNPSQVEGFREVTECIKIDVLSMTKEQIIRHAAPLRGRTLLAEKVESDDIYQTCKHLGFKYFQGFFFAKPIMMQRKKPMGASSVNLLNLINLVQSEADNDRIVNELALNPELSFKVLRIVNSAAMGLNRKISSLQDVLMLMGRKALAGWLQMLLYSEGNNDSKSNPLLQTAAVRGKLMELLAKELYPKQRELLDQSLMTGVLSLLDIHFGMTRLQILDVIQIHDSIRLALMKYEGHLGMLLKIAEALESHDHFLIDQIIEHVPELFEVDLNRLQMRAMQWANQLS
jgi:c-di-GMP-related signal transduction protein